MKIIFGVALAATISLLGCGGTSGMLPNVYVGTYSGPYDAPSISQSGTVNMMISQDGAISGTQVVGSGGTTYNISGTMDDSGFAQGSITQAGVTNPPSEAFSGTFAVSSSNVPPQFLGHIVVQINGSGVNESWNLNVITTGLSERRARS